MSEATENLVSEKAELAPADAAKAGTPWSVDAPHPDSPNVQAPQVKDPVVKEPEIKEPKIEPPKLNAAALVKTLAPDAGKQTAGAELLEKALNAAEFSDEKIDLLNTDAAKGVLSPQSLEALNGLDFSKQNLSQTDIAELDKFLSAAPKDKNQNADLSEPVAGDPVPENPESESLKQEPSLETIDDPKATEPLLEKEPNAEAPNTVEAIAAIRAEGQKKAEPLMEQYRQAGAEYQIGQQKALELQAQVNKKRVWKTVTDIGATALVGGLAYVGAGKIASTNHGWKRWGLTVAGALVGGFAAAKASYAAFFHRPKAEAQTLAVHEQEILETMAGLESQMTELVHDTNSLVAQVENAQADLDQTIKGVTPHAAKSEAEIVDLTSEQPEVSHVEKYRPQGEQTLSPAAVEAKLAGERVKKMAVGA